MTSFAVTFRAISIHAALELQLSSIFEGTADVNGLAFYFDAMVTNDVYVPVHNPHMPYALREGNGLRITLLARDLSVNTSVSLGAVVAEAELGASSVEYEIKGVGLQMDVIKKLMLLKGKVSVEFAAQLDKILSVELPKMLESPGLPPDEFKVPLPPVSKDVDPRDRARTISYAISCVAKGRSLKRAREQRPPWAIDPVIVSAYARVVPALDHGQNPNNQDQIRASTWLSTGQM